MNEAEFQVFETINPRKKQPLQTISRFHSQSLPLLRKMIAIHFLAGLMPLLATIPSIAAAPAFLDDSDLTYNETMLLHARAGDYQTSCEVGDGSVGVNDKSCNEPAAFTELWDAVENELCTEQGCDFQAKKCVTATEITNVCIAARGTFLRENRLDFIRGARGIFDRTVVRGEGECDPSLGYIETGTDLVDFQATQGDYSGYGIRVELSTEDKNGGLCGQTVNTIAKAGSTLPEVGTVFGLVAFFCSASGDPVATLQATG